MFKGSMTALITPFKNGAVDEKGFQDFCRWQIDEGTDALVPVGTTGESPTLDFAEHKRVIDLCIEAAAGRVPVIAGTGSNSTAEAIELTGHAQEGGCFRGLGRVALLQQADAGRSVPALQGDPRRRRISRSSSTMCRGRTSVDMTVETMARLAKLPHIVGVKDATADLARPMLPRLAAGPDFCQLSGEDATVVPFLSQGGHGCISVTSNVAPRLCAEMHDAWAKRRSRHRHDDQ